MDGGENRKKIDLYMTLLITYFFIIALSFSYMEFYKSFENYIMLLLAMTVAVVSYYTNVTLSLIVTLIIDFGYSSYNLYLSFVKGLSIGTNVYYWVIAIPLTAVVMSLLARCILNIQIESNRLEKENKALVMIDPATGIRNSIAFFNELPIYMSLGRRYNLPITLMLVRFKYSDKVKNIVGKEVFKDIIVGVSNVLKESLRFEDRKYILNDQVTFAFILISEGEGCKIVKNRFKENLDKISIDEHDIFNRIKLEVQVGYYTYNDAVKDAFDFLSKAEMEIEYDV